MGLLCLNLLCCSILRLKRTLQLYKGALERIKALPLVTTSAQGAERIEALFRSRRMRCLAAGEGRVYCRGAIGFFGSFVTHLGLLLSLIMAGLCLGLSTAEDYILLPGESAVLPGGSILTLSGFHLSEGEEGLDYESSLSIADSGGGSSIQGRISVNAPLSFGGRKYYQQSYGVLGCVGVKGESRLVEAGRRISPEGENGISILAIYPDYVVEGEKIIPLSSGTYARALYALSIQEGESSRIGALFVGDTLELGDTAYSFYAPALYSGIRVKATPPGLMALLYMSFGVLTAGLFLCFFVTPAYGRIEAEGYALFSPRRDPLMLAQIARIMQEYGRPES